MDRAEAATLRPLEQVTYNATPDLSPSYSPNASHIAYSAPDGNDSEIYRINLEFGHVRQLTNNNTDDSAPSWGVPGKTKVPYVRELSSSAAGRVIRDAGLVPRFTGDPQGPNARVVDQEPNAGTVVDRGSTVTCRLTTRGNPP